jgi:hypothetical protein
VHTYTIGLKFRNIKVIRDDLHKLYIEDVKIKLKNKQISEKIRLLFKKLSKEDQLVEKGKIATAKNLKIKIMLL